MDIYAYAAAGYAGSLVSVEVDIRRGLPGMDIVGLPDGAVRESRDRVRVALKRSGFDYPSDRILVNLSPAGLKKEGASYDLPVALGILHASGQIDTSKVDHVLCAGELQLDGSLRSVEGVLPAVAAGLSRGVSRFIVPEGNLEEARAIPQARPVGISCLRSLVSLWKDSWPEARTVQPEARPSDTEEVGELADLKGQGVLRRALELAAAGGHHLLAFGPPGCGKTMGLRCLAGLLPDMIPELSLETTRIWSQSGRLGEQRGLLRRPPFREPHHSASAEGLIGGGGGTKPGEVSLAHGGILFLDESPEFGIRALQALREPLESKRVDMARAGRTWWYPAGFQLCMAMNPCSCGNLGREDATCLCSPAELSRHWRKIGAALLDRVDIRVPVMPIDPLTLLEPSGESTDTVRQRVESALVRQSERYGRSLWKKNADIPPGDLGRCAALNGEAIEVFTLGVRSLGLSSRAGHGVIRVARTIADLADRDEIVADDILEALQHRRYGDKDLFWRTL